jgi:hypothetical protein
VSYYLIYFLLVFREFLVSKEKKMSRLRLAVCISWFIGVMPVASIFGDDALLVYVIAPVLGLAIYAGFQKWKNRT